MLALTVAELDEPMTGLHEFTVMRYLEQFQFLLLGLVLCVEPYYCIWYGQYKP